MSKHVEVLSPCGGMNELISAISAGCDAVYFSGKMYGARSYANNFDENEIVEAIKLCHLYNVLAYVTVNTIIYENEFSDCIKYIDFLYENDVDAIIIQDIGLAYVVKNRYKDLEIHASTQMNAQTVEDVKVLKELGFSRVVLGREVSIDTIKEIKENVDIEIEVFVHGALCISYSGNCYFSYLEGGRSANRGKCAGPCRLLHKLNGKEKYYLSPKDLKTIDNLDTLLKYVDSLKIEGRMKSSEYVYYTTKAYKNKVLNNNYNYKNDYDNILMAFNRNHTKGFILNENNNEITNVNQSNHQGLKVGTVVSVNNLNHNILLQKELRFNDGIRIKGNKEDAIIVNQMYVNKKLVKVAHEKELVTIMLHKKMNVGDSVYITKREEKFTLKKLSITGNVYVEDNYLVLSVSRKNITVTDKIMCEQSDKDFTERITTQLCKTNDTNFVFTKLVTNCKNTFVKLSEINNLRRTCLNKLQTLLENKYNRTLDNIDNSFDTNYDIIIDNYNQYSIITENEDDDLSYFNIDSYDKYVRNYNSNTVFKYLSRVETKQNGRCVFSNLGALNEISSVYLNVVNSYSVRALEKLGVKKIGLSFEMTKQNIKDLIDSYVQRYNKYPVVEVMVYGYIQMMYMKHCFVKKEYNMKNTHCNKCKDLLLDDKYRLYKDKYCHLAILSSERLNLLDDINELKRIGIKHFLIDTIN